MHFFAPFDATDATVMRQTTEQRLEMTQYHFFTSFMYESWQCIQEDLFGHFLEMSAEFSKYVSNLWRDASLPIIFLLLSMHRLRHRRVRGGGSPDGSHMLPQPYATGGWADSGTCGVPHTACRKTHNQDNPSDTP